MKKYNGWHNVDTWLLALWLSNDEASYKEFTKNKSMYLKMNKRQLIDAIINISGCSDGINKKNVFIKEIKEAIKEL